MENLNEDDIDAAIPIMAFTDERMIPELSASVVIWDHIYRYKFAVSFARGRDVLDIASGEGYGTAAIAAAGARSVIGVDIDVQACEHAKRKYGKYGIDIRIGSALDIPVMDGSVDLVISFETIEHVPSPQRFLDECFRVLRPGGSLIVSTPNVDVYNPQRDPHANPFHCAEMSRDQFIAVLQSRFAINKEYVQRAKSARFWHPRSLAAARPWLGRRGFGLLWKQCWSHKHESEAIARRDPVAVILQPEESLLGRLTNSSLVRPYAPLSNEVPTYLIAHCTPIK